MSELSAFSTEQLETELRRRSLLREQREWEYYTGEREDNRTDGDQHMEENALNPFCYKASEY